MILSSNRRNAGAAYLDLKFDHKVDKLVFDSTLWGKLEGLENKFRIQYYKNGSWYDCFQIDTEILPKDRNVFKSFVALFPNEKSADSPPFAAIYAFSG